VSPLRGENLQNCPLSNFNTGVPASNKAAYYQIQLLIKTGISDNFEKFLKTDGKVCANDFDHLGAAYN